MSPERSHAGGRAHVIGSARTRMAEPYRSALAERSRLAILDAMSPGSVPECRRASPNTPAACNASGGPCGPQRNGLARGRRSFKDIKDLIGGRCVSAAWAWPGRAKRAPQGPRPDAHHAGDADLLVAHFARPVEVIMRTLLIGFMIGPPKRRCASGRTVSDPRAFTQALVQRSTIPATLRPRHRRRRTSRASTARADRALGTTCDGARVGAVAGTGPRPGNTRDGP